MKQGELNDDVLRSVSRSFYLSMRLLPIALRKPVGLAYLLARTTDTIADTTEVPAADRLEFLDRLSTAIQEGHLGVVEDRPQRFAALQRDVSERKLIESLPGYVASLSQCADRDRWDVRALLAHINEGQRLDITRFGQRGRLAAIETVAQLRQYTYLVAGCVGEFWTEICARYLPNFADRDVAEMNALGVNYGRGLQLINILRDIGDDLRDGRCYMPAEELAGAHISVDSIFANRERFVLVHTRWRREAEKNIADGIEYAVAIQNRRVRVASALPALIGARTLALIREAGTAVLDRKIKVPRQEVRAVLTTLTARLGSRRTIRALYERLRR